MLSRVTKFFSEFAPVELGESWDNVGVLVENPRPNKTGVIGVTIDLTPAVLEELLSTKDESKRAEVIIAYHPPIFSALKKFRIADPKQKIILDTIVAGASIYSPHTCVDSCRNSINDWLVESAVDGDVKRVTSLCPITCNEKANDKLKKEEASSEDSGSPTSKSVFETVAIGAGRIATFEPLSLETIVNNLKKHLNVPTARVSLPFGWEKDRPISKIAVCAGSGAGLFRELKGTEGKGVELLISGEMGHHDVLAANDKGKAVVLFEHTNSERGYLANKLVPLLKEKLGAEVKIILSERDRDPLVIW
eukprot:GILI01031810.1.p1 GENE.GILI01031810.1~~GILI01031810.1.p1  ORF type:complete len:306 (-),score=46.86 GILI01031810.1:59-976(-)